MKMFRRLFDKIKGFCSCDECFVKDEELEDLKKKLQELKARTKKLYIRKYEAENGRDKTKINF